MIVGHRERLSHSFFRARAQVLADGYIAHLEELKMNSQLRPAPVNARIMLPKGGFSGLRNRPMSQKLAKRTISYPLSNNVLCKNLTNKTATGGNNGKHITNF